MSHFIKFVIGNASIVVVKINGRNVSGFIFHRIMFQSTVDTVS